MIGLYRHPDSSIKSKSPIKISFLSYKGLYTFKYFYIDKDDIKEWHLQQPEMPTEENWPFKSQTIYSLIKDIKEGFVDIIESNQKEAQILIEFLFIF